MVTSTQVREMVKAMVEAHATHNTFYSIRNAAKDRPSEMAYPCAVFEDLGCSIAEDTSGLRYRVQRVQLLVITCLPTDRNTDTRDAAIDAAERAALDIVLGLESTYREFVLVQDIRITNQADQYTTLETGVLLAFTVRDLAAACITALSGGVLPTPTPMGLSLDDLLDVDATDPEDGDVVAFDLASGRWKLTAMGGGGTNGITFDIDPTGAYLLVTKDGTTNAIPMLEYP